MATKIKVRNNWNSKEFPTDHEVNDLPSETVPDQALSVKTILERYARGIPLTETGRVPIWYTDQELQENKEIEDIPDLERLDLSERMDILEAQKQKVKDMQVSLQRQEKARQRKLAEQAQKDKEPKKEENLPGAPSAPESRKKNPDESKS